MRAIRQLPSTLGLLLAALAPAAAGLAQPAVPPVDQTLVSNPASASQRFGQLIAGDGHLMVAAGEHERRDLVWTPSGWSFVSDSSLGASTLSMRGEFFVIKRSDDDVRVMQFDGTGASNAGYAVGHPGVQTVAMGPDQFAIGFSNDLSGGSVQVFRRVGATNWQFEEMLVSSTPGERFGASLDFDDSGTVLWIGAPGTTSGSTGRVERRVWTGSSWIFFGDVKAPLEQTGNLFGEAIAADGSRLAVGAPGHDRVFPPTAHDVGAVYLYQIGSLGAIELEASFTGEGTDDELGTAVDILDATAIAGAPGRDLLPPADSPSPGETGAAPDGTVFDAGEAQVYWRTGNASWEHVASLRSTPNAFDDTGTAVALVGSTALVGAPGLDGSGPNPARGGVLSFRGTNAIFVDGFEDGETGQWSGAAP